MPECSELIEKPFLTTLEKELSPRKNSHQVRLDTTTKPLKNYRSVGARKELLINQNNNVGEILKRFRVREGLSQKHLGERVTEAARRIGIQVNNSHSYISKVESKDRFPSKQWLLLIATAMELTNEEQAFLLTAGGYAADAPEYPDYLVQLHQNLLNPLLGENIREYAIQTILALNALTYAPIPIRTSQAAAARKRVGSKQNP